MNDTLEQALTELIQKILSGTDAVIAFGSEQLPEVIQQLMVWELTKNSVIATLLLIGFIVVYKLNVYAYRQKPTVEGVRNMFWDTNHSDGRGDPEGIMGIWIMSATYTFIGTFLFIGYTLAAVKILVAPKVWLLEYAAQLIK